MLFKTNSIQQQLAAKFDKNQSHVSRWIKTLIPLLHKVIPGCHCQPAEDMDELLRLLRQRNEDSGGTGQVDTLNEDATARLIGRSIDVETQKNDFSGKHHGHRVNSTRNVVAHAVAGVKRLALLAQPIMYWKQFLRHQFFIVGCGLHNLRVRFRARLRARRKMPARQNKFLTKINYYELRSIN